MVQLCAIFQNFQNVPSQSYLFNEMVSAKINLLFTHFKYNTPGIVTRKGLAYYCTVRCKYMSYNVSLDILFWSTNSPELEDVQFTIMYAASNLWEFEKQNLSTFLALLPSKWLKQVFNHQNSWQYFFLLINQLIN